MVIQQYRLGAWQVCPEQNVIYQGDEKKHLDHKSMQVLLYLIKNEGVQLTKGQILNAVWGDKSTSNDILAVAISNIRKALGDSAQQPNYIKTIPSIGYCLIATVTIIEPEKADTLESSKKTLIALLFLSMCIIAIAAFFYINQKENSPEFDKNQTMQAIAVLPFIDLGAEKNNDFIIDGLADAVIDNLSQVKQLKVVSRQSSFSYRNSESTPKFIGKSLGVNLLLSGSVQRIEQKLRVITQLTNVNTNEKVWSETFDGETKELFTLQDNIASAVIEFLGVELKRSSLLDKEVDAKAYELNLLGNYYWQQRTPEALQKAITYFEQAIVLEPLYAKAHLGLANSYYFMHGYGDWTSKEARKKAWPLLRKALEIDPSLAGAYATIGLFLSEEGINNFNQEDPELLKKAEQAFIKAIELSPNESNTYHWYGNWYFFQGQFEQAITMLNKALSLNPLSPAGHRMLAEVYLYNNKYNTAQKLYHRSAILKPDHDPLHFYGLTFKRLQLSDIELLFDPVNSASENCERAYPCFIRAVSLLGLTDNKSAQFWQNKMVSSREIDNITVSWMKILEAANNNNIDEVIFHLEEILVNRRFRPFDRHQLIVALLQANKIDVAMQHMLLLNPNIEQQKVNADNYFELINYSHLLQLKKKPIQAKVILESIDTFLATTEIVDQQSKLMKRSEVNAMLGNNTLAIKFLSKALTKGWLPDFSREWWHLKDNIHFVPLKGNAKFEQLLIEHQQNIKQITLEFVN